MPRQEAQLRVLGLLCRAALLLGPLCTTANAADPGDDGWVAAESFGEPLTFAAAQADPGLPPPVFAPPPEGLLFPPGPAPDLPPAAGLAAPVRGTPAAEPPSAYPCPTCGPANGCNQCDPCREPWYRLFDFGIHDTTCGDAGIGQERVMLAPFFLDVTQPFTNVRVDYDSVYGFRVPNRSEFLWAAPPKGPKLPEQKVDYTDLRFVSELAVGKSFSVTTTLPVRSVDPVNNPSTTGFGDMSVATKLVLLDGRYWQFTQLTRTYINTGSAQKGLGNGHVTIEPGILGRYEWSPRLYFHGQLAFWVPIGGDPQFSGPAINYGVGASYVAYETDTFAALPTLELVGWSFLDGMKTLPNGSVVDVNGDKTLAVLPGVRFVLGPAGDLGLFELGIAGGAGFGSSGWFDGIFRTELRWSF